MNKSKKTFVGKVTSAKMRGVAIVEVERRKMHPIYHKSLKRTKNYHAINSLGAKTGDQVSFIETRPISRTVRWQITQILNLKTPVKLAKPAKKLTKKSTKKQP